MKRMLVLFIGLLIILPLMVYATGGGLRKNSIKTCPNGVTYGLHSDGKGGTHWHVAITNGTNYYADGAAIYNDPCPNSRINEGTAKSTNDSNSSSNTSNNQNTNNSYNNSISQSTSVIETKSGDNSLKKVIINGVEMIISDNMNYQTEKKRVSLEIEANDSEAKVEYENKELSLGKNIINIVVSAPNGMKRNYVLTINKISGQGTATIKKFVLWEKEVKFEDNKAIVEKTNGATSLDYSYELSNKNAKLKIYLNDKIYTKHSSIKENDKIKLVVLDENDNENVYEITITSEPLSITSYIVTLAVIALIVGTVVLKIKK